MQAARPDLLHLRNAAGDEAVLSVHGAQLLSWRTAAGEHLYLSPTAAPAPGRVLRGGTPVCFPQFANRGPLAKHGFARNQRWEATTVQEPGEQVAQAVLELRSDANAGLWDHAFDLRLAVRIGPGWLELELQAGNPGPAPYIFTGALHTYFAVDDVRSARVQGLQSTSYQDALDGNALKEEMAAEVMFEGELDRVYLDPPGTLQLLRPGQPALRITQQGFTDTVVWNPGPVKGAALGDMPAADWLKMVCVEAAVVNTPVRLAAGEVWRGLQRIALAG